MKAMILAAGRGQRMGALTQHCPKPMLRIGERPLIEHHVRRLASAGFSQLVINLCYLGDQIEDYLGDGEQYGVAITYSKELTCLETGGGIYQALPLLGEDPFCVINGDVWTDYPLENLRSCTLSPQRLAHLILIDNPEHNPSGDFDFSTNNPETLTAECRPGAKGLTFAGISVLSPLLFLDQDEGSYPLAPILRAAMSSGVVTGERFGGEWTDVGTPERLRQVNQGQIVTGNEGQG